MLAPQEISVYLNNELKATRQMAELDLPDPLPETVSGMPDIVSGRFLELEPARGETIRAAYKRVMILNATEVLYTFTFDPATGGFVARKR